MRPILNSGLSMVICSILLAGCSAGSDNTLHDPGQPVYNPFIMAVRLPAQIHAGSAFTMTLTLALNEDTSLDWLGGPVRDWAPADLQIIQQPGGGSVTVFPFLNTNGDDGRSPTMTRDVEYPVGPLAAGEYTLTYYAAATRAETGIIFGLKQPLFDEAEIAAATHRFTQSFTVLP